MFAAKHGAELVPALLEKADRDRWSLMQAAKELEVGGAHDLAKMVKAAAKAANRARYRWPSSLKNTDAELRPCIALSAAALDGAALPSPRGLRPSGRIFSAFEEDPKRGPRRGRGPPISRGTPKIWSQSVPNPRAGAPNLCWVPSAIFC
jgi:hypothetical protein